MLRHLPLVALLAVVCGCTSLAPTYDRPDLPVTTNWPRGAPYAASAPGPDSADATVPHYAVADWEDFIVDPTLRQLVSLALSNNRDVRVTALNIQRAQAQYQIEDAALLPQFNANAADAGSLTPANLSPSARRLVLHDYSAGIGLSSYELDFFGRLRNLRDAALQRYLSSAQAHRSNQISLIAQVTGAYFAWIADQGHLSLARTTLNAQQSSYDLNQRRFEIGSISKLDLSQARTAVDVARGDVARYTTVVAQDINALTLLLGAGVPDLQPMPDGVAELPALQDVPAGLPSDLLHNRPDILEAEHQLKASDANIGVARAAFFPSITLTGSLGFASSDLNKLWQPISHTWLFVPQISFPIFDGGRNAANLSVARTDQQIAVAQYERAIQVAFREVADALAVRGTIEEQLAAQQSLVQATETAFTLSSAQFKNGVSNYLVVLDSQRALYAAQQDLIALKLAQAVNRVTLYKALGGGSITTGTAQASATAAPP
jgi:multidrug efflux system outer membrane protein